MGVKSLDVGVLKTNKYVYFLYFGSSWFIYTPTKKNKYIKIEISNQNIQNPTKSPLSNYPHQKYQYRTQYRKTLLKSTLSPISYLKFQPTIQTTFFLYKYKIIRKIHTFTDYKLLTKNHIYSPIK